MQAVVDDQLHAEGELCRSIYELMVGHRYSVYNIRDAVDLLSGQLHRRAQLLSESQTKPEPGQLADFAFRGAPASRVFSA